MRTKSYFSVRLLATVFVVVVPLLATQGWLMYSSLQIARDSAFAEVQAKSQAAAASIESTFERAERLLVFVTTHADILSLDPTRCSTFLRGLEMVDEQHAVVSVLDMEGRLVCTSVPGLTRKPPSAKGTAWFTRATSSETFYLGGPAIGRITGKPVVPLSLPVRDADRRVIGLAVVSLDLVQLQGMMLGDWSRPRGVISLINADREFLVRSPDTLQWIGRTAPHAIPSVLPRSPGAAATVLGADGIERMLASTPVSRFDLRAAASIPTEDALAVSRAAVAKSLLISVTALAFVAVLAFAGASFLARPVRSLVRTTRAFAEGRTDVRADDSLPGEFRELATELNVMQAARLRSQSRTQRITKFYEVGTRTNQAILRLESPAALYEAICQICVDTGQASMAWIGLVEGGVLTPLAWSGNAKAYTDFFGARSFNSASGGLSGAVVRDGRSHVANDYLADPRTQPFRDNAMHFGVRASAAVPITRAGTVIGTLSLYATEPDFFDEELMGLLSETAADISLAIEAFDKAEAHERTVHELERRDRDAERSRIEAAESNASNIAKTEFLSRMSHELRTPLNAVLGFSQLLQERAKDRLTADERHQLELIFLAGAQLRALVDDVLDVSIIEAGQLTLSVSDFDLVPLLDGALRMSEPLARANDVRLSADYAAMAPVHLRADPNRVRQVVLNLLSNAIKYNRPNGTVTLAIEASPGRIELRVTDTGIGLTEEQLGGLYQPFNRLGRENSGIAGTGIGMTIVKQLVIAMNGTIDVKSVVGDGTVVQVVLPNPHPDDLGATASAQAPSRRADTMPANLEPAGVVLYIEDSPVNVLVVKKTLARWPAVTLAVAEDGASGIRMALAMQPDLVLLDMRLPDMSGIDVLGALRADERTRDLRVVSLSASAMPREVALAREAGAFDYWTKPIEVVSFCRNMERFLR